MVENYEPKGAFKLIIRDFERAWECLAKVNTHGKMDCVTEVNIPGKRQGPMFFGFLAMNLLEYICRLCAASKPDLLDFSNNLNTIESKYFIHIQLAGLSPKRDKFCLPYIDEKQKGDLLLTLLFDTIRNGLVHLYQPTIVSLKDEKQFYIVLKNASGKMDRRKNSNHLCYDITKEGNLCILVYPQYLLRDFQAAAEKSSLFDKGLLVQPFERENTDSDIKKLEKMLRNGGASRCTTRKASVTHH